MFVANLKNFRQGVPGIRRSQKGDGRLSPAHQHKKKALSSHFITNQNICWIFTYFTSIWLYLHFTSFNKKFSSACMMF